jgi:hypothetical protein
MFVPNQKEHVTTAGIDLSMKNEISDNVIVRFQFLLISLFTFSSGNNPSAVAAITS